MNVTEMKGSGQYLVEHVIIISFFFFSLKSTQWDNGIVPYMFSFRFKITNRGNFCHIFLKE